jgi:hypothetical protein
MDADILLVAEEVNFSHSSIEEKITSYDTFDLFGSL